MTLAGMTQEETKRHNEQRCKRIADELDAVANGRLYRCEFCGNDYYEDELEDIDGYDDATCPNCRAKRHFEALSMAGYLEDIYDIKYTVTAELEYWAARITIAFGGPGIYIDTLDEAVKLYWWTDRAEWPLSHDAVEAVDEEMESLYESNRY